MPSSELILCLALAGALVSTLCLYLLNKEIHTGDTANFAGVTLTAGTSMMLLACVVIALVSIVSPSALQAAPQPQNPDLSQPATMTFGLSEITQVQK